mgnify:CR=1 FL=1
MAKRKYDSRTKSMVSGFKEGSNSSDYPVSSSDGMFPSGVVMKDYPQSGYHSAPTPYDGISGIDQQLNEDARKLGNGKKDRSY